MFAQTRSSLQRIVRLPVARAASHRLDEASRNVAISCFKQTSSNNITLMLAAAASAAAVVAATTAAASVPSLCEEDRMERWNDRWATGRVVRVFPCRLFFLLFDEVSDHQMVVKM